MLLVITLIGVGQLHCVTTIHEIFLERDFDESTLGPLRTGGYELLKNVKILNQAVRKHIAS